jgi:predicted metalloprotease
MQYNDDAQLDTSVVEDARAGGGGGGGLGGIAVGGGGLGIVGLIIVVLLQVVGGGSGSGLPVGLGGLGGVGAGSNPASVDNGQLRSECKTGADANTKEDCAIVADIDSVESFWTTELPKLSTR